MITEKDVLYVLRNTKTGKLLLSYTRSGMQQRKALFYSERTAKDAAEDLKYAGPYSIEKIS